MVSSTSFPVYAPETSQLRGATLHSTLPAPKSMQAYKYITGGWLPDVSGGVETVSGLVGGIAALPQIVACGRVFHQKAIIRNIATNASHFSAPVHTPALHSNAIGDQSPAHTLPSVLTGTCRGPCLCACRAITTKMPVCSLLQQVAHGGRRVADEKCN